MGDQLALSAVGKELMSTALDPSRKELERFDLLQRARFHAHTEAREISSFFFIFCRWLPQRPVHLRSLCTRSPPSRVVANFCGSSPTLTWTANFQTLSGGDYELRGI